MSGDDRAPCSCRCGCTASSAGGPCWLCSRQIHSPGSAVREHLAAGADAWRPILASLTPDSSSGISRRALARATDTWLAWHARSRCPLGWKPA